MNRERERLIESEREDRIGESEREIENYRDMIWIENKRENRIEKKERER